MKKKVSNNLISKGFRFFLAGLEKKFLLFSDKSLQYPPVFVIGPPRSGTTLLYQLLTQKYYFSYFSEYAASYNTIPFLASYFTKKNFDSENNSFESNFGRPHGLFSPSEAGEIWNRWFPTEYREGFNYVDENHLSSGERKVIYQLIRHIEKLVRAPFINKNVKHGVRIRAMNAIFPDALFIEVYRNPFDNAASIWEMRQKLSDDHEKWVSVMPKEIDKILEKDIYRQIAAQIFSLQKNIKEDMEHIGNDRLMRVSYEELCRNPVDELESVELFLRKRGCTIKRKSKNIQKFEVRSKFDSLPDVVKENLKRAIKEYG